MLETQAERLIERLKSACTYHRFDEPRVHAEYIRFLMRHDFERMDEAIDLALEEESRNVPAISLISKKYHEINNRPRRKADVQNQEYCAVCDNKGFVLMAKYIKNGDEELPYQYVLYCPFCAVGRTHAFDGSQCKEKIPYKVPPLTKYFDDEGIEALREANLAKRRKASENIVTRIDFGDLAIGRPMPNVPETELQDDFEEVPF